VCVASIQKNDSSEPIFQTPIPFFMTHILRVSPPLAAASNNFQQTHHKNKELQ